MTPTLLPQADIFERDFVSVDLETTGLNANADAIIEVGAVKFSGGVVQDRYQTFVNPGRPIPAFVQQLTSISPSQIERAPRFQQIAAQFAAFVGDLPIVGHNIAFDISFLASHGLDLANRSYNTWDLASIFLPTLAEYNLSALAKHLELDHSQAHRAVADAETTALVFHRLLKLGASYPAAKIAFIARAARTANAPVADLLEELVPHAAGANSAPGTPGAVGLNGLNLDGLAKRLSSDPGDQPGDAVRRALTEQQVEDLLAPHGVFANSFPGFEDRPQQAEMLKAVTRAIYQGRKLIVEGGTGIGKSIAYLLPAVLYSATHGHRVVISTNTISLQEQLMDKDIPAVISILEEAGILEPGAVRAAQLKGRSNYVCLRRWTSLGASDSLTEDEARVLGKTAVWLDDTENGDRTDLNLSFGDQRAWSRVCADNQGVCQSFRSGAPCFLRQARQRAEAANILVVNHALLLADLAVGGTVLQDYQHLVIDEAHHLEEEASRQLGFEIAEDGLPQELDSVYRLIRHLTAVANQSPEDEALGRARDALTNATASSNQALQSWQQLWDVITRLYQSHSRGDNDRQPVSLELTVRQSQEWSSAAREWESFSTFLSDSVNRLTEVGRFVDQGIFDLSDDSQGNELIGAVDAISELNDRLASVFGRYDEEQIQWIDMVRRNIMLHSTPLSVGPILSEKLFQQKETVVLTGSTLSVGKDFRFLRQQVGFPSDQDELVVESPYNYQRNVLLMIPEDLPDPRRGADHARGTAQVIINMAQALDGHVLALFTSHSALREASFQVRRPLRAAGINVLAQGIDGTPRQLQDRMREDPKSVLLGTASFWTGVDFPSGVLRGLVICRLPFPVPTDPIVKARGNLHNNPFNDFQVPTAVLRFRQGFGRLIRNKMDRGVVVILDRRIQTANYGDRFLNSLPTCSFERSTLGTVGQQAARWLQLDRAAQR
jgi:DNA polymerase-3 subunit epsilon/ATP-dependent DNA helicase DinG